MALKDRVLVPQILVPMAMSALSGLLGLIGGLVWERVSSGVDRSVLAFRPGMVVAFARSECPYPWKDYIPAYGRFVRGIDPNGKTDPDGTRYPGDQRDDGLKAHSHQVGELKADVGGMVPGKGPWPHIANFVKDGYGEPPAHSAKDNEGGLTETRPKSVALRYCLLSNDP